MRKVLLALLLTAVGLGLLLSFRSRSATGTSATTAAAATPSASAGSPTSPTASASKTTSAGSGAKSGTFTGAAESNPFGEVQVQAVLSGGKLTNVVVLQVPDRSGYEDQIVQDAIPELKSEALSAQSANIDVVSGATYTSQGYAESLQSALDQAGL
jgi:uncharacterized protein with FMN-binding domain